MSISVMGAGETMGRHGTSPGVRERLQVRQMAAGTTFEAVVILGAGPAGLLAAHAVALAGREPIIFSAPLAGFDPPEPARSQIGPATYLHAPIPDITNATPDAWIKFLKVGTERGYANKVYGDPNHPTSWSKFEGDHACWDLGVAYEKLWLRYADRIVPQEITSESVRDLVDSFPHIINTIPAKVLCVGEHSFPSRPTWTIDQFTFHDSRDPLIVYDGHVGSGWQRVRSSRIFGKVSTEFAQPPGTLNARQGIKVQATNCDCWPEIVRAGRWGEWRPGVLVDHAFKKVWDIMFDTFEGA